MTVLPEIHVVSHGVPRFPDKCPGCGAKIKTNRPHAFVPHASYACGATYTDKPQIQNHTDKYWGRCPK